MPPPFTQHVHFEGVLLMSWDQIIGSWTDGRLRIKERWSELTDVDVATIRGQRDRLVGLLQEKCGYAKGPAEKALNEFLNGLDANLVNVERT